MKATGAHNIHRLGAVLGGRLGVDDRLPLRRPLQVQTGHWALTPLRRGARALLLAHRRGGALGRGRGGAVHSLPSSGGALRKWQGHLQGVIQEVVPPVDLLFPSLEGHPVERSQRDEK